MFRIYLSQLQAHKDKIHTLSELCIVGFPTLTILRLYNTDLGSPYDVCDCATFCYNLICIFYNYC
jgi:hypothetical protein